MKYSAYKLIGREARNYLQFIITKYIWLFPWSVTELFLFFISADCEILRPNSSAKLDKILINCRQDLIWIAYDLTAGSGIISRSLASFPHLRPLCDCFQLKALHYPKYIESNPLQWWMYVVRHHNSPSSADTDAVSSTSTSLDRVSCYRCLSLRNTNKNSQRGIQADMISI